MLLLHNYFYKRTCIIWTFLGSLNDHTYFARMRVYYSLISKTLQNAWENNLAYCRDESFWKYVNEYLMLSLHIWFKEFHFDIPTSPTYKYINFVRSRVKLPRAQYFSRPGIQEIQFQTKWIRWNAAGRINYRTSFIFSANVNWKTWISDHSESFWKTRISKTPETM